jgi:hypothetical protein
MLMTMRAYFQTAALLLMTFAPFASAGAFTANDPDFKAFARIQNQGDPNARKPLYKITVDFQNWSKGEDSDMTCTAKVRITQMHREAVPKGWIRYVWKELHQVGTFELRSSVVPKGHQITTALSGDFAGIHPTAWDYRAPLVRVVSLDCRKFHATSALDPNLVLLQGPKAGVGAKNAMQSSTTTRKHLPGILGHVTSGSTSAMIVNAAK